MEKCENYTFGWFFFSLSVSKAMGQLYQVIRVKFIEISNNEKTA